MVGTIPSGAYGISLTGAGNIGYSLDGGGSGSEGSPLTVIGGLLRTGAAANLGVSWGTPYQVAANGPFATPGDFSGGFHNAVRDFYYNYFNRKGWPVAKEVTFSGLAPNPRGDNTSDLDLMVTKPPRLTPTGIEIKTGDSPTYTQPQSWIYPQILVGHSYSFDPQIEMFGFQMGAPSPPIPIDEYYAQSPGSDVRMEPISPEFYTR